MLALVSPERELVNQLAKSELERLVLRRVPLLLVPPQASPCYLLLLAVVEACAGTWLEN